MPENIKLRDHVMVIYTVMYLDASIITVLNELCNNIRKTIMMLLVPDISAQKKLEEGRTVISRTQLNSS